jgi:tetratricopeptide (TPR) repeat protein
MKIPKSCLVVFIFGLFLSTTVLSQNIKIDSLKIELLKNKQKDTTRVNLLNELADLYFKKDLDKTKLYLEESRAIADAIDFKKGKARGLYIKGKSQAIHSNFEQGSEYFIEALQLYKAINYNHGISTCYNSLGVFFFRKREYKTSIEYYLKSVKLKEEIGDRQDIINGLFYIGKANVEIGNYPEAIKYYTKALDISKETNNVKKISNCLSSIGNVYSHQGNYPLALEYHNEALDISIKDDDDKGKCDALISIGNVYIRLQNYDKAIAFHDRALIISKQIDSKNTASILNNLGEAYKSKKNYKIALKYYDEALEKFNNKPNEAITLNNIGNIYLDLKNYTAAYQYFEKSKAINIEYENKRGLCSTYLGIARVHYNLKDYDKALNSALKSKAISSELNLLDIQSGAQQLLSKIYKNKGQYKKAFASHQQFKILNDSLFNKENIEKITQLEFEYKYKQKLDSASIRELKLTKTVTETNKDLQKSQQNYLWSIIAFLVVSMLFGGAIFYLKYRNVKSEAQNIIIEQKLLRSQMTPHFIFNTLSVLQGMVLNKEEKKSVLYLSKFSKLLRIILENSRDKMVLLSKELAAIENYLGLQNLENEDYQYAIKIEENIDLSLFQIPPMLIQPFIENAIEHAFVNHKEIRKINIHLIYVDKKLICKITDNGIGIDSQVESKRKDKKSLATMITTERLKMLSKDYKIKGSITIEDRQKYNAQGTVVTLVIPHIITT